MVLIENIDGHAWSLHLKTAEISAAMVSGEDVCIHLGYEGPDIRALGLYELLDRLCASHRYPKSKVTIRTWNVLEHHPEYNLVIHVPSVEAKQGKDLILESDHDFVHKDFAQIKHFGFAVGRSNWRRLFIAAELYSKYRDKSILTFHYDGSDAHRAHLGFEELANAIGIKRTVELTAPLLANTPIKFEEVSSYPILEPHHWRLLNKHAQIFLAVVSETYVLGNTFFNTEKTWRPIMALTPFVIDGPTNYLRNLRTMGFKTFGDWWDESYDELPGDAPERIEAILGVVEYISKKSTSELRALYEELLPTLRHNYDVFMSLGPQNWEVLRRQQDEE